jgi:hypothetical protein
VLFRKETIPGFGNSGNIMLNLPFIISLFTIEVSINGRRRWIDFEIITAQLLEQSNDPKITAKIQKTIEQIFNPFKITTRSPEENINFPGVFRASPAHRLIYLYRQSIHLLNEVIVHFKLARMDENDDFEHTVQANRSIIIIVKFLIIYPPYL